jgi:hypothetical protein
MQLRLSQSSSRIAANAKNASRSVHIGCIFGRARRVESRSAATARRISTPANMRTPLDIPSSHPRNWANVGFTVIPTKSLPNIDQALSAQSNQRNGGEDLFSRLEISIDT